MQPCNPGLRVFSHNGTNGLPNTLTDDHADGCADCASDRATDEHADDSAADDEQAIVLAVADADRPADGEPDSIADRPADGEPDSIADGTADDATHGHSDARAASDRGEAPRTGPVLVEDSGAYLLGRLSS